MLIGEGGAFTNDSREIPCGAARGSLLREPGRNPPPNEISPAASPPGMPDEAAFFPNSTPAFFL